MYCSQCGTQGAGNFCTSCGTRLATVVETGPPALVDWSREVRYDLLMSHPDVRDRVAKAAGRAGPGITAETVMKVYDKFVAKAVGGIEISDLSAVVVPLLVRFGVQTGKHRSETIEAPPGRTIVAVLCSLAARGRAVKEVHQATDGCAIEAVLPSDVWSWEGTLLVTIVAEGDWSRLDAQTKIGGQMYDWGKSTKCLEQLIEDVHSFH